MAAQRIRAANSSGLPRCKSEGTLIDLSEGFSETSLSDVKGEGHYSVFGDKVCVLNMGPMVLGAACIHSEDHLRKDRWKVWEQQGWW